MLEVGKKAGTITGETIAITDAERESRHFTNIKYLLFV